MNLKEAFQAQNKIENCFNLITSYLYTEGNVTVTKEKHLRSKAVKGLEDEILDVTDINKKIFEPNKAIKFCLFLISERAQLAKAIHDAKEKLVFDFDSAVDMNKKRREALDLFRKMSSIKNSSLLKKNGGSGYVFNNEGNQTEYYYDLEIIKTIDFDRNKLRANIEKIQKETDVCSNNLDKALINTEVDYNLPFDLNDNLVDILENFD